MADEQPTSPFSPAQVEAAASAFANALDKIAATMDKHGTSAWISSVGLLLIVFGLATKVGHWGAHLGSGEFITVLLVGLVFVLVGVLYRLYARVIADAALRGDIARRAQRAKDLEQQAETESKSVGQAIEDLSGAAPKG